MLPTELLTRPLAVGEPIVCALLVLLGIAAKYQSRAQPNQTVPKGSVFSHREKASMLRFAQAFVFGVACSFLGLLLFVNHERSAYSNARLSHVMHISAAASNLRAPSSQKVR